MNVFLIVAVLMLALSLVFVLCPLLRTVEGASAPHKGLAGIGAASVAGLSVFLYAMLGTPAGIDPPVVAQAPPQAIGQEQIEGMVQRLAQRLAANPNDAAGWRRLIRSYETLRRFEAAADAYRQLLALEPDNADVMVDYAVVLGMTLGQRLSGAPEALIGRALKQDPDHLQALALAGSAALERGDKAAAVLHWNRILALAPPESPLYRSISESVAKARE